MRLFIVVRDGVINFASNDYIKSAGEWIAVPGSLEAIARLNHFGYRVAVVTLRTGLESGATNLKTLNAIHEKMHEQLARVGGHIDGVFFRPGKNNPGADCDQLDSALLSEIGARFGSSLGEVPVVVSTQDRFLPAIAVGARPVVIRSDNNNKPNGAADDHASEVFKTLSHAVEVLTTEIAR